MFSTPETSHKLARGLALWLLASSLTSHPLRSSMIQGDYGTLAAFLFVS